MEIKFLDIVKDLGLTILLLRLVGGIQAIVELPNNFGPFVVIVMFASIAIPMGISTLHLAVNNLNMFLPETNNLSPIRRNLLKTTFLILLFPLVPVFLETHYLEIAERARTMAQSYNIKAVREKLQCQKTLPI